MTALPQSIESEKGLLSSFLISPALVGPLCAAKHIGPQHFAVPMHVYVYEALVEKWQKAEPVDFILVTQALRDKGLLDECGGESGVTGLFMYLPTAANAERYIDVLIEKHNVRRLILACQDCAARGIHGNEDSSSLLSSINQAVTDIGVTDNHPIPTMRDNVKEALDALTKLELGDPSQVRTGLKALDVEVGPMERGNLLVIGGQTKAGKSILATQIAVNIGMDSQPVLFFSLEMTRKELTMRMLSSLGRVDLRAFKIWNEFEERRFTMAQKPLTEAPIHIVTQRYDLSDIVGISRQFHARYAASEQKLACIVLDYAQLVVGAKSRGEERRQQEVAAVSRTAKQLASELDVLFILLTQLNDDGRAREARDIEMDANIMLEVGHNPENGNRGVRVYRARSAPCGQLLKLNIIPQHTRVEDADEAPESYVSNGKKKQHH